MGLGPGLCLLSYCPGSACYENRKLPCPELSVWHHALQLIHLNKALYLISNIKRDLGPAPPFPCSLCSYSHQCKIKTKCYPDAVIVFYTDASNSTSCRTLENHTFCGYNFNWTWLLNITGACQIHVFLILPSLSFNYVKVANKQKPLLTSVTLFKNLYKASHNELNS